MSDSQVMECARGHWIIDTKRAENCDYLIAVNHGLIVGVYENMKWYSSGVETPFYPRLCKENLSRSNRKYCTCQAVNKPNIYINKNIADLVNMTQNPISYINGRKNTAKVLKPYYEKFINNSMDIHDFEMNFGNDLVKMGFKLGSFNDSKYEYNNKNILNITDYNQLKKNAETYGLQHSHIIVDFKMEIYHTLELYGLSAGKRFTIFQSCYRKNI
mgnify:FL=1